jgi:hypothetical protein
MIKGTGRWSYDESGGAWYFALTERADPPYRTQVKVEAIIYLHHEGRTAGIEMIDTPGGKLIEPPTVSSRVDRAADRVLKTSGLARPAFHGHRFALRDRPRWSPLAHTWRRLSLPLQIRCKRLLGLGLWPPAARREPCARPSRAVRYRLPVIRNCGGLPPLPQVFSLGRARHRRSVRRAGVIAPAGREGCVRTGPERL